MKNLFKRIVALTLCAIFSFSLVACGASKERVSANEDLEKLIAEQKNLESQEDLDRYDTKYAQFKLYIEDVCYYEDLSGKLYKAINRDYKVKLSSVDLTFLTSYTLSYLIDGLYDLSWDNRVDLFALSDNEIVNLGKNIGLVLYSIGFVDLAKELDVEDFEDLEFDLYILIYCLIDEAEDIYDVMDYTATAAVVLRCIHLLYDDEIVEYFEENDPEEVGKDIVEGNTEKYENEELPEGNKEDEEDEEKEVKEEENEEVTPGEENEQQENENQNEEQPEENNEQKTENESPEELGDEQAA